MARWGAKTRDVQASWILAWVPAVVLVAVLLTPISFDAGAGAASGRVLGLPQASAVDPAMAQLGRQLFMDKRLSANQHMACATCHVPAQGFTQNDRPTPAGRDGQPLRRNASTLLNVGFATPLMHDGAAPSLEAQVLTPLLDGNEMANTTFTELEQRLAAMPGYGEAFRAVFGEAPSMAHVGSALAAYQRRLVSGNSAFDRWMFGGEKNALSESAQRGFALFSGKARCTSCHLIGKTDALLTDNSMHNTGVATRGNRNRTVPVASRSGSSTIDFATAGDRGRHEVTQDPADLYRFRTPTLRNVALTAPYMHDGSMATLDDVVRFYNAGGGGGDNLDPVIKPLELSDADIADVIAFLEGLTGDNVDGLAAEARRAAPAGRDVSP